MGTDNIAVRLECAKIAGKIIETRASQPTHNIVDLAKVIEYYVFDSNGDNPIATPASSKKSPAPRRQARK